MQLHEETVFHNAIEIEDPEARLAYLDEVCAGDKDLRERIERLISVYPMGAALEPVQQTSVGFGEGESIREHVGDTIGNYKLLEQLGEGGMGMVYMAEQSKPVRRKVALKIIKLGMDTGQVVARFEAERQALALMNHPNIAKVLDAGETETGRPFFVMELVRGIPITEFCQQQKLGIRDRLELFVDACEAVHHAHQKGIIHRDLKPSNLMVELHDTKAVPKIINFGIAKATNQRLTERTLFTNFSQMIGTPTYMSPEQAQLSGLDIDTRTDIYSLGVLLFELLTGTTPITKETASSVGYDELRRIIKEDEPPRPSTRISTLDAQNKETLAVSFRVDRQRVQNQIRGDLDWIVVKALEKDRTRRYQSASEFADDIQRYLNSDPVDAHPPSKTYRLRKFARRNKFGITVGALAVLACIGGIIGLVISTVLITYQRDIAQEATQSEQRQRETAEHERDQANLLRMEASEQRNEAVKQKLAAEKNFKRARNAVDELLVQVSENALLNVPSMQPLRKNLLEAALKYYLQFIEERSDDPDLEGDLASAYYSIGELTAEIGSSSDALAAHRAALAIRLKMVTQNPANADLRFELAQSYFSISSLQSRLGNEKEGLASTEAGMMITEQMIDERPAENRFQLEFAKGIYQRGDNLEAIGILEGLIRENPTPETRRLLGRAYGGLAISYAKSGRAADSEVTFAKAIEVLQGLVSDEPAVISHQQDLAICYENSAMYSNTNTSNNAESSHLKALEILKRILDENPSLHSVRFDISRIYNNLGNSYKRDGRIDDAESSYKESIRRFEHVAFEYPERFSYVNQLLIPQRNLALLQFFEKRGEPTATLRKAMEFFETLVKDNPQVAHMRYALIQSRESLVEFLLELERSEEAANVLNKMKDEFEKLINDFPDRPEFVHSFALFLETVTNPELHDPKRALMSAQRAADLDPKGSYLESGQYGKALPLLKQIFETNKVKLGENNTNTLHSMKNLAQAYMEASKPGESLPLLEQVLEMHRADLGEDHNDTLYSTKKLAEAYKAAGQYGNAVPLLERTFEMRKAKLGQEHLDTLDSISNLGEAYKTAGRFDKALPVLEQVLKMRTAKLGGDHRETLESMSNLGEAYKVAGQFDKAAPLLEQLLKMRTAKLGKGHTNTLRAMENLALVYRKTRQFDKALPLLEQTVELQTANLKVDHPVTLTSMTNLARVYQSAGQFGKALPIFERIMEIEKTKLGEDNVSTLYSVKDLGTAYTAAGHPDKAILLLEQSLGKNREKLGKDHNVMLASMYHLSLAYKAAGQLDNSLRLMKQTVEMTVSKRGNYHAETLRRMNSLAAIHLQINAFAEAETLLRKILADSEKAQNNISNVSARYYLGKALFGQQKYTEAEPLLLEDYGVRAKRKDSTAPRDQIRLTESIQNMVKLYEAWHTDNPNAGYDTKATQWKQKLEEHNALRPAEDSHKPTTGQLNVDQTDDGNRN